MFAKFKKPEASTPVPAAPAKGSVAPFPSPNANRR